MKLTIINTSLNKLQETITGLEGLGFVRVGPAFVMERAASTLKRTPTYAQHLYIKDEILTHLKYEP